MKKALKITAVIIVILLAALIAVPFLMKDKIKAKVIAEINNNVNAKVDFKTFDLTIFKNFPNLTLELGDFSIVGINEFNGDTLAAVKTTSVTVDIMSVISGGQIKIKGILLDQPVARLLVLENGKANWDIAKSSDSTAATSEQPSEFKAALSKYEIRNGFIDYNDLSLGFHMLLDGLNHSGSGDFTSNLFTLKTKSEVGALSMEYGGIPYIVKAKTSILANLEMDMLLSKYRFSENEIKLNELVFGIDGFVAMPTDDISMDLKFDVRQNEFKNFISMIPGMYKDGFDKVTSKGKLALNGYLKGTFNDVTMPGFGLNLNITNGMFKYPDLPTAINNVNVDLSVTNPDGIPDHTLINLRSMHAEMGSEPFDARIIVKTPVSDANIDATIKGMVDLANISKIVPLEAGTKISGVMKADLKARGYLSSIESKQYEKFNASGNFLLEKFNYVSADFKQGAAINSCELIFNPKNVTLNTFDFKSGNTDLKATGWLDNLLSWFFRENELLRGTLDLQAGTIDLNELMGTSEETTAAADTTPMQVVEAPSNIEFQLTAKANKIIYDDLILENAKGNLAIRDRTLGLNDFSFNMLDGSISMDGLYETKDIRKPFFFFNLDLTRLNIRKTYDKFVAVQKLAPIAKQCSGNFSSTLNVKGNFSKNMEPEITSMSGDGKLNTHGVTIDNFTPLVKVADALKMEQFKKLQASDLNLSFSFENGRVNVKPFDVTLGGIKSTVQGSNGFDQTIDYNMNLQIPTAMMGSSATGVVSGLISKANQSAGTNLSMGKEVKVNVKIGGTVTDPKIETGVKDMASNAVDDLKNQAIQQLNDKKKELENKAKAEAEKLKSEAEAKAKAEADRLKKEAEAKAKAEADKLKKQAEDKLKKEAEDKLKNLFGKPKK